MSNQADRVSLPTGSTRLWDRLMGAIQRGVVGFFRQSEVRQSRRHTGSPKVQEEQLGSVRPFGVNPEDVTILLAYGESGRENVVRQKFRELTRMVKRGKVGLILLARHDRLGRNFAESEDLFRSMREQDVLIMVDGRVYDPADESDDFVLTIYAKFAEYENRARTRWMSLARFAKARDRTLALSLPTSLVWADPTDPVYRARLLDAGMGSWLERLDQHRTQVFVDGVRRYILPFPDERVERCTRLLVEWTLETGSVSAVARRVEVGFGRWPVRGKVPSRRGATQWKVSEEVSWTPVTPDRVYDFLRAPALFGTYQYSAPGLDTHIGRGKKRRLE